MKNCWCADSSLPKCEKCQSPDEIAQECYGVSADEVEKAFNQELYTWPGDYCTALSDCEDFNADKATDQQGLGFAIPMECKRDFSATSYGDGSFHILVRPRAGLTPDEVIGFIKTGIREKERFIKMLQRNKRIDAARRANRPCTCIYHGFEPCHHCLEADL